MVANDAIGSFDILGLNRSSDMAPWDRPKCQRLKVFYDRIQASNAGYQLTDIGPGSELGDLVPPSYNGPHTIDTITADQETAGRNIDRKIQEIGEQKCNRITPCCAIKIKIECGGVLANGQPFDSRCGQTITYNCGNPRGVR